jgi:CBS domain-containing membrane protein
MKKLLSVLGIESAPVSHAERIVSAAGGFCGILGVYLVSTTFLPLTSAALIVASMGASAVLLFAVPHGPLSQPWPVLAGHLVSAVIGVTCARWIPGPAVAGAIAVGLAIGAMHYLRAIHPPGGATALVSAAGGQAVHDLGYQFVITPVLLNVAVILTIAIVFNAFFPWRRYPGYFKRAANEEKEMAENQISHGDLVYALSEIDSYVDISERDLLEIYKLATQRPIEADHIHASMIMLRHYYCNGNEGKNREIRQIVDEDDGGKNVIYKVVYGHRLRESGLLTREEFADWAKYEVKRIGEEWERVER